MPEMSPAVRALVVVPTLGERLATLARTLKSIRGQAGLAVDIVLVARDRSAGLETLAGEFGAELMTDPGRISAAVNAGFARAGEAHRYAAWLGDDDQLRPGALAAAIERLEAVPAATVAFGSCDYVDVDGNLLFTRRPPPGAPALLQFVPGLIKQEACVFRMSSLRAAGGLDESLKFTMDLDLLLRLRRLGPFVRVERVQAAFCWHPGSLTVANRAASLAEAQQVQSRQVRGLARALRSVWKPPVRWLILVMSWKINQGQAVKVGVTTGHRDVGP